MHWYEITICVVMGLTLFGIVVIHELREVFEEPADARMQRAMREIARDIPWADNSRAKPRASATVRRERVKLPTTKPKASAKVLAGGNDNLPSFGSAA
jgi:hypothetical protein